MSVGYYPPYSSLGGTSSRYSRLTSSSSVGYHRPSWANSLSAPPPFSRQTSAPAATASSYASMAGTPSPPSTDRSPHLMGELRRGKWTLAEEEYTTATIQYFCSGTLGIPYGTTLRSYLAQQLHCDPMRISKKLIPGSIVAGYRMMPKIGRRGYYPRLSNDKEAAAIQEQVDAHLKTLREAFIASFDALREEEDEYELLEARHRDYYYQRALAVSAMVAMPLDDGEERSPVGGGGRKRRLCEAEWATHYEAASPHCLVVSRPRTHSAQSYSNSSSSNRHHDDYGYAYQWRTDSDRRLRITPPLAAHCESAGAAESPSTVESSLSPVTQQLLPPLRVSLQRTSLIMAAKYRR